MNSTPEPLLTKLSASCPLFSMRGTWVYLHWSFFLLFFANIARAVFWTKQDLIYYCVLYNAMYFGPALFIAAFMHELGHTLMTWRLGGEVDRIILWPFGGWTYYGPNDKAYIGELKVTLAGPLMQLPLMLVSGVLYLIFKKDYMESPYGFFTVEDDVTGSTADVFITLCRTFFWLNVIILVLSIVVPVYPLGGVRLWAVGLRACFTLPTTALIMSIAGFLISLALFGYGIYSIKFRTQHDYNGGIAELTMSIWGILSSFVLFDAIKSGRLYDHPAFNRPCYGALNSKENSNVNDPSPHVSSIPSEVTTGSGIL